MAQEVILSISLIIAIAAVATIIARLVRQPLIIAYLISGVLAGPLFLNIIGVGTFETIQIFSHIGVIFLLFIVGLSLDLRVLKEVGKVSFFAGISEIIITGGIGFLIAIGIGFSNITALYIGAAIAFSSTVVVVKILSDKKEIDTLHGRIALGILIIEDFVAAAALMIIPVLNNGGGLTEIAKQIAISLLLIGVIFAVSTFIIKRVADYLAQSQETLFLFGIAWALSLATLFNMLGFSLEIGALIAGISLSTSKYNLDLSGKIKPLRDFFIILFFVFFGSQLATKVGWEILGYAMLFSLFVVIGKPIIVMTTLKIFGYKKRTNFLAGSSIAQISEFSLILLLLGYNLGHITQNVMSLGVLIAIITIGISSYSIYYSHIIYNKLSPILNIFEGKRFRKEKSKEESYEIILFGYHRMGYKILKALNLLNVKFAVVDYNPRVVLSLGKQGINCIYGDAGDEGFLSDVPLDKTKIIISTIPDKETNLIIRDKLNRINSKATFIATTEHPISALDLYKGGVDYVILPHYLGGDYAAHMIKNFHTNKKKYKQAGNKHRKDLSKYKNNPNFSF